MELDVVQHKRPGRPPLTPEQKKRFQNRECLNCGKQGHFAKDCRQKKVNLVTKKSRQVNMVKVDHESMHWMACYNEDCLTHHHAKEDAGWFPKEL